MFQSILNINLCNPQENIIVLWGIIYDISEMFSSFEVVQHSNAGFACVGLNSFNYSVVSINSCRFLLYHAVRRYKRFLLYFILPFQADSVLYFRRSAWRYDVHHHRRHPRHSISSEKAGLRTHRIRRLKPGRLLTIP